MSLMFLCRHAEPELRALSNLCPGADKLTNPFSGIVGPLCSCGGCRLSDNCFMDWSESVGKGVTG